MNTAVLLVASVVYFALAYFLYGRFLNRRFGVDPSRPTPAHTDADGIDYAAAKPMVLFGHHFASIAGAGPIVGPVLAARYGWLPALCWILVGCVFIGAMHDFAAMFLSVRNRGRSIAYVIEKEVGYAGRQVFIFFCLATLVLVVTVFTQQVAATFITTPSVATASILFIFLAPIFGVILNRKLLSLLEASLIFVPLTFLLIWVGTLIPLDLTKLLGIDAKQAKVVWTLILLYYAFIASTIPVWFLLQPRDYLNSFLLYAMMILGIGGAVAARETIQLPAVHLADGARLVPDVLPLLFVTIACGACSGFHALVASGTSSKQINSEKDIRIVGYGGMLLEGVLAVIAICSVGYLSAGDFQSLFISSGKAAPVMFASGVGHFVSKLGIPAQAGMTFITLAISAFILTSLDTATRLARFLWQELILPRAADQENGKPVAAPGPVLAVLSNRWFSTIAIVLLALLMAFSGESDKIWPVFGSANQLLAAMTLLAITLYLFRHRSPILFTLLPMLFMGVISVWALVNLLIKNAAKNHLLFVIGLFLLLMAGVLAALAVKAFRRSKA